MGDLGNSNCCVLLSSLTKNTKDILGEMIEDSQYHDATKIYDLLNVMKQLDIYIPSRRQLLKDIERQ